MELPFHTAIPYKFVRHSHSVYFLLCSISGLSKKIVQYYESEYKSSTNQLQRANNPIWIHKYDNFGFSRSPKVIFLENHGIIVSSETDSKCMYIIKALNNFLANFLESTFWLIAYNEVFFKDFKIYNFKRKSLFYITLTLINLRSSLSK